MRDSGHLFFISKVCDQRF